MIGSLVLVQTLRLDWQTMGWGIRVDVEAVRLLLVASCMPLASMTQQQQQPPRPAKLLLLTL